MGPTLKHRALRLFGHQHWIRRGRDKLLRLLDDPDGHASISFEVDFFGFRYCGDMSNFIDWTVYYYGCLSRNELLLLDHLAKGLRARGDRRLVAVDIGANIGHHTLFLAGIADAVYSFEPYPAVLEKLKEKIARNGLSNVTVIPVGLGNADGLVEFFEPTGANIGIGTFVRHQDAHVAGMKLPMRRGTAVFEAEGIPKVDLLKVDVEGYEHLVFEGLRERLESDRPIVLSELSDPTRAAVPERRAVEALFPPDYRFVGVGTTSVSGSYRLEPFAYMTTHEFLACPAEKWDLVSDL